VLISDDTVAKKRETVKEADLLLAIKNYIRTNYEKSSFVYAEKITEGTTVKYEVKINNTMTLLIFNAEGKLLSKDAMGSEQSEPVKEADLLAPIKEFIKKNYPNTTFISAEKYTKNNSVTFIVKLKKDSQLITLKFDGNGKNQSAFLETNNNITLKELELPEAIKKYLANLRAFTFVNAQKNGEEGSQYYLVVVKVNGKAQELKFDSKGNLIIPPVKNDNIGISQDSLPKGTRTYMSSIYPGYTFKSAKKLVLN
jgi:hypothetical protein